MHNLDMVNSLEEQVQKTSQELVKYKSRSRILSWIRFLVFITGIYFIYLALYHQTPHYFWLGLIAFIVFGSLMVFHNNVNKTLHRLSAKIDILTEEQQRIDQRFDKERAGKDFIDTNHDYAYDLDVFGIGSLYQHLNRLEIPNAEKKLAHILQNPLEINSAKKQQESIKVLVDQPQWCLDWQSKLRVNKPNEKYDTQPLSFPNEVNQWLVVASILLTLGSFILLFSWWFFGFSFSYVLGILPFNMALLAFHQQKLFAADSKLSVFSKQIQQYLTAFEQIQGLNTTSTDLVEIKANLSNASLEAWKRLVQIIYFLDSRSNILYWLINPFLFIDTWIMLLLVNWGQKYGSQLPKWMAQAEHVDCLVSLAGYTRLHLDFQYPELTNKAGTYQAKSLGHPLISKEHRVSNDFDFENKMVILTGSNMSGKSTFLRTIGLCHVMAWVGLPVPASKLVIGPSMLFTSMRTFDNLNQNTSSFYAELKRIKTLLSKIQRSGETPILYFLDEILKGTNSQDRHTGAVGLVKQLIQSTSKGFISTHDLELAYHFQNHHEIKNYSFNSTIKEGKLDFDYHLTPQICQSSNASDLMHQMGIITSSEKG